MIGPVRLINLRRRPDRLRQFEGNRRLFGWELPEPQVVPAVDGTKCPHPTWYVAGPGAWGCARSHIRVVEDLLSSGADQVVVLEDDLSWDSTTWPRLKKFLTDVPEDWALLMLGGQHMAKPEAVRPGVVRCVNTHRTHAYVLRRSAGPDVLKLWYNCRGHIDHALGPWQAKTHHPVYAPDRFLFGQAAGLSDINGQTNPAQLWSPPDLSVPLFLVSGAKADVAYLRENGVHTGHDRHPVTDLDRGLDAAVRGPAAARPGALKKWADVVLGEAAAAATVAACWHPAVDAAELAAAVAPRKLVVVPPGPRHLTLETVRRVAAMAAGKKGDL